MRSQVDLVSHPENFVHPVLRSKRRGIYPKGLNGIILPSTSIAGAQATFRATFRFQLGVSLRHIQRERLLPECWVNLV
jgi:hypothetical protein